MEARNGDGTFRVGHSGFKPKGSANEFQSVTREKLGEFLKSKLEDLPTIYENLSARDKSKLLLAISEFFLPKMKEIVLDAEGVSGKGMDLSQWSEQDLRLLISLQQKYDNTK